MVLRISHNGEQGRAVINRVMEIDANSGVNTIRIIHHEEAMERTRRANQALQQQLDASCAEVIELRLRQRAHERHLKDVVCQLADLRFHPRNTRRR